MPISVTQTRDAVVTALNEMSLTPVASAQAIYDIALKLADLKGGRIVVVPASKEIELITRGQPGPPATAGKQADQPVIHVAVQYKYANGDAASIVAEIDPYMQEAETIAAAFPGLVILAGSQGASLPPFTLVCIKAEMPEVFHDNHMREFRVFTSVVALTFLIN